VRFVNRGRRPVQDWLSDAVPGWLTEAVRPKPSPPPWADMARAMLAIAVPLTVGFLTGRRELGLLPALGGLFSVVVDNGGPYLARVRRVSYAAVFGGAPGLAIGSVIHHRGWIAVIVLVIVAGVSALMARLGGTGSVTGLQLLTYSALGLGPLGKLHPWWHIALEFAAGVVWALLLIAPGWLFSPRSAEQRLVAAVYHAIAADLRAIGAPESMTTRRAVTAALNAAYDALFTSRAISSGRSRRGMRLVAILNVSHQMTEAITALRDRGERPPQWVIETIDQQADAIEGGRSGRRRPRLPPIPPQWSDTPGTAELRESIVALCQAIARNWALFAVPSPPGPPERRERLPEWLRKRANRVWDQLIGGRVAWTFTIRLMTCIGVAAVVSEVLPVQRSYWVVLTVGIILKPDFGSVFTRALQRGIGTVLGAVFGAAILAVVPYGPLLLIPFGILAALLPYGKNLSFGLTAVFLTPLVVLLVDLLAPGGWRLAEARAIDTVLACAIALVIGYLPWPGSWYVHLPGQFAATLRAIADYMEQALAAEPGSGTASSRRPGAEPGGRPAERSELRRQASRALSDLRAEFQRTLSEPAAVSRRASAWWPALVSLEEVVDAITVTVLSVSEGKTPAPSPESVHRLSRALRAVADAIAAGTPPPATPPLPSGEELRPVTAAVRSVLGVLAPGQRG
jgi:uncharacterized membrane protein YccC